MTTLFNVYSCLLTYPDDELLAALPAITATLEAADALATVQPLLDLLQSNDLISLQENYVATFDRTPSHSLHIFEHVHGESRDCGQAMVDLVDEYRQAGFDVVDSELPDYVPLFLEFLSLLDSEKALTLLDDAVHVLAHIGNNLGRNESPYQGVFTALEALARVEAGAMKFEAPRDMDEAMVMFGTTADGCEPLLNKKPQAAQAVKFYTQPAVKGAC